MKAAIILFAATETPDGTGRMANALTTAREMQENGDDVRIIFDGAGVTWAPELLREGSKYGRLLGEVRESVAGVCLYCARAYGVKEDVEAAGLPFLDDYRDHPSIRGLLADGYQVVTF